MELFLYSLLFTCLIEAPIVGIVWKLIARRSESPATPMGKTVGVSVLASCLTLPYLWFVLPSLVPDDRVALVGEPLVVMIEGMLYATFLGAGVCRGMAMSLVANACSWWLGPLIISMTPGL